MTMKNVAVFGAAETGKSSLIARFLGQAFEEAHKPTVEDFYCSQIYSGESLCYLNIIDTSGSFEFPAMERLAMEKADAFIFVYSIDNIKSFEKVKTGLNRLCEVKDIEKVPVIVVCNKADLEDITALRGLQMKMDDKECLAETTKDSEQSFTFESVDEVSSERTLDQERDFVLKLGCKFLLTSAKFRWNVNRIFYELFDFAERQNELITKKYLVRNRAFVNIMKLVWRKVSCGSQS